ncbi:type VI secretion system ATPase TssH [Alkalilimnicola sp. S0819]|uniref:type VI secretion system ATPase TssH n=1 Tax=Alkalilimnicola sp. S0819 TaxID=2613922 RepID=UPI0012623902|nr:type VI secretion system ATPase TssH [Alkalilimnicola sp. S0819]KAB7622594.1 type VI secretion system ATPase TssH [Alkalilimnicola sp. S0819]MPQ17484.1 type VI secretion system ATPase TssH [Alkalilimnicola sp. S0819]
MELEQLIERLDAPGHSLFEQAVALAANHRHAQVEPAHWLHAGLREREGELNTLCRQAGVDPARARQEVEATLDRLRAVEHGFPRIAPELGRALFEGWLLACSEFDSLRIRPAHLLLALRENPALRPRLATLSPSLNALASDALRAHCRPAPDQAAESAPEKAHRNEARAALERYTVNLTARAATGAIDPVPGRDEEIRQIIDVLCRRRQNNPILTGEAGVGKTAVVEGLALRIAAGQVPEALAGVSLRSLDLGLLQAGAGVKGEFEQRLKHIISAVQDAVPPVILFIDEAHTLIGAGNTAGGNDAANLLKPALARGELRTIAATTWSEYKQYVESDAALSRRFQLVKVEEPDDARALLMLRSLAPRLEQHHQVPVLEEALHAAVRLSRRYISGRLLPDKGVSLLDTACARAALSRDNPTPALLSCRARLSDARAERQRLQGEQDETGAHQPRLTELSRLIDTLEHEHRRLEQAWQKARELLRRVGELRCELEQDPTNDAAHRTQLRLARAELAALQGEQSRLFDCVDEALVARVVADWTGIPVGRMQAEQIQGVLDLQQALRRRVRGQDEALTRISEAMQTARAKLADPRRPLGVFMLLGPSGVGKTETALALAEQLYGSERALTVINMSEFKEEHKVSLLMGSPPGYVGYGEGGLLTEAVRRRPYGVVLLDEMEKAHPGVQDIFYQVFDKGMLRDGEGRDVDFRNTVILLTSNSAGEEIRQLCESADQRPTPEALLDAIAPVLRRSYRPAFLGRLHLIPYQPLAAEQLRDIARLQLAAIQARVREAWRVPLDYSDALIGYLSERCHSGDTGARQITALLNRELLPRLSRHLLRRAAVGETPGALRLDYRAGKLLVEAETSVGGASNSGSATQPDTAPA